MILDVFLLMSIRSIDDIELNADFSNHKPRKLFGVIGRFKQIGGKIIVLFCRREVRFRLKLSGISEN